MIKKGLGKGLSALIKEENLNNINNDKSVNENNILNIDINKIQPDKNQPRKNFDEKSIEELALSIKNIGIISPIIVKKKGEFYEIVSGERRFRAAKKLKLKKVPIIVKEYDELETMEAALIENIQRENLNPIEEALTYKKFQEKFDLSQEEIAEKVGKNRVTVTNAMRLLKLDERVQNFIIELKLSQGHAKALLAIIDNELQFELAERIIDDELSVRQIEDLVKKINAEVTDDKLKNVDDEYKKQVFLDISKQLNQVLGTKVNIKNKNNKGKIEIEYYSEEDLDRLVCILKNK